MAQTDTRTGFRLPWAPEPTETAAPEDGTSPAPALDESPTAEEPVTPDTIDATASAPARRPTKFMADLSRAMQTAAEGSRDETMVRFLADSKTVVEEIEAASTVEAASLRRRADDDVAAVREWSKAEIARIREETEARIAARKSSLDGEMDAHTAVVEARVAKVGSTVEHFQAEMDAFFVRLHAEEDPTRIATMAESMPDPPDLAGVAASIAEPAYEPFDPLQVRIVDATDEIESEPAADAAPDLTPGPAAGADVAIATRLDFAAAEAEALAFTGDLDDEDGAPVASASPSSDHIAGLVPADRSAQVSTDADAAPSVGPAGRVTSRVVVLGLVSVASIATFKRGLSRSAGVAAVGVASGPDGEFVFTVEHDADLDIASTVTKMPEFEARITAESAGTIEVAAHDPDSGD